MSGDAVMWAPPALYVPPALAEALTRESIPGETMRWTRLAVFEVPKKLTELDIWKMRACWTNPAITPESDLWDARCDGSRFRRVRDLRFVTLGEKDRGDWTLRVAELLRGELPHDVAPYVLARADGTTFPAFWRWLDWEGADDSVWKMLRGRGLPWDTAQRLGAPVRLWWKDKR